MSNYNGTLLRVFFIFVFLLSFWIFFSLLLFFAVIYLFNLNNRYDLDGDFKWNTARLINHSCDPNCEVEGKGLEIWVTSIKFIKKGEELSYDYGFGFDQDYKQFPCKCGSKKCCGYIVREGSRWRINKKFRVNKVSK